MTLKQLCTSKDLSQQLKAAGMPQNSVFSWVIGKSKEPFLDYTDQAKFIIELNDENEKIKPEVISAFTSGELGEILRTTIPSLRKIVVMKHRIKIRQLMERINRSWQSETELEDRAALFLYLVKEKIINLSKL